MINAANAIRRALFDALNLTILYEGDTVPYYENQGERHPYQIILNQMRAARAGNAHSAAQEWTFTLDIIAERPQSGGRKEVDEIGSLVMAQLKPEGLAVLALDAPLQNTFLHLDSQSYLSDTDGAGLQIERHLLTYTARVNQMP